jgi:hypothetical protein
LIRNRLWSVKIVSCTLFFAGPLSLAQTTKPTNQPVQKPASSAAEKTSSNSTQTAKAASASAHKSSSGRHKRRKTTATSRKRGQQAIDPKRAQEIQDALIREHYLSGEPSSTWNDAAQKAMQRYQADHGWQSKQVPDSRALIKLGLGPDHEHLLNPETAMTTQPEPRNRPASEPVVQPAVSSDPASTTTEQK